MEGGQGGTYLRQMRASSGPMLYSTAEEGHCDLAEIFIFVSFHLYVLAMLTHRPDDTLACLR